MNGVVDMPIFWWILPGISLVLALTLLFAGFAKLANLKPFAGVTRLAFGTGFLGLAFAIGLVGLNVQTYSRLTYERPVATVRFTAVPDQPDTYRADVVFGKNKTPFLMADGSAPVFKGKQWMIGARVLQVKPMGIILGYDSLYRLEFMASMDTSQFSTGTVDRADFFATKFIEEEPGLDIGSWAKNHGGRFGIFLAEDANYGSATYNPMGDGFEFEVRMTQTGLKAEATPETLRKLEARAYPGFN